MPTSADLLLDTSAAIALVRDADPAHKAATAETRGLRLGLSGHALVETFSVLTRLPGSARVPAEVARRVIETVFPASVALPPKHALGVVAAFTDANVAGGAVYDGLVGLAARAAAVPLLSNDHRAARTYAALGVEFRLLPPV